MKILFISLLMFTLCLNSFSNEGVYKMDNSFKNVKKGKKAILLLHFGSTYADTRAKTIDVIRKKVKKEFPDYEVREAFTSRIIMRILKNRDGITIDNPSQALHRLAADGYTHVIVQATHIINGAEAEALRDEISKNFKNAFESIKIGNSLLTNIDDYKKAAKAIYNDINPSKEEALVLVGHGTFHPGNSAYGMLDSLFKYEGMKNVYVATIEGYPELSDISKALKEKGYKKIILAPFMFVAGDHANNDIAVDFKEKLEEKGFKVKVIIKGLGENKEIQDLFVEHIKFAISHVHEDMLKKKKEYSKGKH